MQVPDTILIDARTPIVSNMKYLGACIANLMGKSYLAPLLAAEQKRAREHFYKKETLVEVVDSLVDKAKADAAVLTRDVVRVNSEVVRSPLTLGTDSLRCREMRGASIFGRRG